MARIALISLPKPHLSRPHAQAPLGLLYIAAVLEGAGHDVRLYNFGHETLIEALQALDEADVYGISAMSMEIDQAVTLARLIRLEHELAFLMIGGPGPTHDPTFHGSYLFDLVFRGEAERTIADVVESLLTGKRDTWIENGVAVHDLDDLPLPARHLLSRQGGGVFAGGVHYRGEQSAVIQASRGCPHRCAFCATPHGTSYVRNRSPEAVAAEVKLVRDKYGVEEFRFNDDTLTASMGWLSFLCYHLEPLDVVWRCSARTKGFTAEKAEMMRRAGCREISFGVESFDDTVLLGLDKKSTAKHAAHALVTAHNEGITARCLLMIRTPFQTPRTIEHNKAWLEWLPTPVVACTYYTPLPGSAIYNAPEAYGIKLLPRRGKDLNFYSYQGGQRRRPRPTFELIGRDLAEFDRESHDFVDWLESTGRINKG